MKSKPAATAVAASAAMLVTVILQIVTIGEFEVKFASDVITYLLFAVLQVAFAVLLCIPEL